MSLGTRDDVRHASKTLIMLTVARCQPWENAVMRWCLFDRVASWPCDLFAQDPSQLCDVVYAKHLSSKQQLLPLMHRCCDTPFEIRQEYVLDCASAPGSRHWGAADIHMGFPVAW